MEKANNNDKIKQFATVYQLAYGIIATIIAVSFWLFAIKSDVAAAVRDNGKQDKLIEKLQDVDKDVSQKMEQNQREILEKLNQIQLQVKDKQDRN